MATLGDNVSSLITAATRVLEQGSPAPPRWVAGLPVMGESLAAYWEKLAYNAPSFIIELKKLIGPATDVAVTSGTVLGIGLLELGLSVSIAFFSTVTGRWHRTCVRAPNDLPGPALGTYSRWWAQP